jgi:ATP-dependent Clp protease protease subunit
MPCPEEEKEERGAGVISAKLLKARTILINGPIEEDMGERVITQALVLDSDSHDPIKVLVTTPGGMVDVGFAIYDVLRYVQSKVICIGAGFVASMGVPIMLAAGRKDRYTLPNTRFMMHQPSTGAAGVASDIRITAQEILKIRERINKLISEETGQVIEKVAVDSDRDFWMSAEEAVEYGLVSKIVKNAKEIG